jgi:hypothetical protein
VTDTVLIGAALDTADAEEVEGSTFIAKLLRDLADRLEAVVDELEAANADAARLADRVARIPKEWTFVADADAINAHRARLGLNKAELDP